MNVLQNSISLLLRELLDSQLTDVLKTFQVNVDSSAEDMSLLPNMEPLHLGQPLDLGGRTTYVGRLEGSQC